MSRKTRVPKNLTMPEEQSFYSFRPFKPRTENQRALVEAIQTQTVVVVQGAAGTGKTALCIQTSMAMLFDETHPINKVVVVRLISDTHNEHLGALPGDKNNKLEHFAAPVLDNLRQCMTEWDLNNVIENNALEILPVSHVLGRTFINTAVVVEEAQNLDKAMVLLLLTRIGKNSVMMLNGDPAQSLIWGRNGIHYAADIVEGIKDCTVIRLPESEIQRHPVIKAILQRAKEIKEAEEAAKNPPKLVGDSEPDVDESEEVQLAEGEWIPYRTGKTD